MLPRFSTFFRLEKAVNKRQNPVQEDGDGKAP
jgi:hypothetical protein